MQLPGVAGVFVKFNLISVALLLCSGLAHGGESRPEFTRALRLPKIFYQLQKREDSQGYLEQCRFVNPWDRQLGYVNVFAFLDLTWTYSYRQAIMLRILKKRLESAGFSDIWFLVIVAPEDLPADKAKDEVEIETWKKIHALDPHDILNSAEVVLNDIESDIESDIIFVQDTPDLGIWKSFHASRDQIVIVDRCGKLTYQVIVPWSILYFPYVKAAILSTYKEDPCGPCSVRPIVRPMDYEEYLFNPATLNRESNPTQTTEEAEEKAVSEEDPENESELSKRPQEVERQNNLTSTSFSAVELGSNEAETDSTTTKGTTEETTVYDYSELTDVADSTSEQTIGSTDINKQDPVAMNESDATTSSIMKETVYESTTSNVPPEEGVPRNEVGAPFLEFESPRSENDERIAVTTVSSELKNVDGSELLSENKENTQKNKINGLITGGGRSTSDQDEASQRGSEETASQDNDVLPIRIIMRVPHLHEENGKHKKYSTVILKTGSPDYHEHYEAGQDVPSLQVTGGQEQFNYTSEREAYDPALLEYIYNRDESPGLYGEVADYWKNSDADEYASKNPHEENHADYEETTSVSEDALRSSTSHEVESVKSSTGNDDEIQDTIQINEADENEDHTDASGKDNEAQRKLIDHYKKLIPWVYYVL